jgi:hypothetical protein
MQTHFEDDRDDILTYLNQKPEEGNPLLRPDLERITSKG